MASLRLFVILLLGATVPGAPLVTATLATNEVHLPVGQDPDRGPRTHQKDPQATSKATYPAPADGFVSYYVEHEQTEANAREYVRHMKAEDLHKFPGWCKPCNATVLAYCRSISFLNDHCCCEYSHIEEQLPWIPHTCMRQLDGGCTANAGTCGKYRAIKECCCDRATKQAYKTKFSTASGLATAQTWQLLMAMSGLLMHACFKTCLTES